MESKKNLKAIDFHCFLMNIYNDSFMPFAVCPYSCSRLLVQSMVQSNKKKFPIYYFADELFGIYSFSYFQQALFCRENNTH